MLNINLWKQLQWKNGISVKVKKHFSLCWHSLLWTVDSTKCNIIRYIGVNNIVTYGVHTKEDYLWFIVHLYIVNEYWPLTDVCLFVCLFIRSQIKRDISDPAKLFLPIFYSKSCPLWYRWNMCHSFPRCLVLSILVLSVCIFILYLYETKLTLFYLKFSIVMYIKGG